MVSVIKLFVFSFHMMPQNVFNVFFLQLWIRKYIFLKTLVSCHTLVSMWGDRLQFSMWDRRLCWCWYLTHTINYMIILITISSVSKYINVNNSLSTILKDFTDLPTILWISLFSSSRSLRRTCSRMGSSRFRYWATWGETWQSWHEFRTWEKISPDHRYYKCKSP